MTTGTGVWFAAPRQIDLISEELPEPGPGQVLIQAECSLISSGTELHIYRGEIGSADEVQLPTTRGEFPFPLQYGYQVVGRIAAADPGVELPVGQRVFVVHPHQDRFVMPVVAANGRTLVVPVPDGLTPAQAAFSNLFAVALNGLLDAPVRHGDVVVVSGLGVVGGFAAHLARATAGRLVLVDPLPNRRERAAWIGADAVVHPDEVHAVVRELSGGRGADVCIEASGAGPALNTALQLTGQEGTVLVLSYFGNRAVPLQLSPEFHYRRLRIVSSMVAAVGSGLQPRWDRDRRTATAFDLLRGIDVDALVTHRLPLSQAQEAYRLLDQEPQHAAAVLLEYADV
jgi:2-desacetyl-2-hydroxyethyl bacteriochlorophyllide A dehydrogenase